MYGHSPEIAAALAKWVAEERAKLEAEAESTSQTPPAIDTTIAGGVD